MSGRREDGARAALVDADKGRVWPIEPPAWAPKHFGMADVIRGWRDLRDSLRADGDGIPLSQVELLAPIPHPRRNLMCVGKNYFDHAHEFTRSGFDSSASSAKDAIPEHPIIFTKVPETVIGPGAAIRYPHGVSDQIDYEVELVVVIGRAGRDIPKAQAMDHVFGYTIANDVTARDIQARHKQWFLGKSLDTFCPLGPWIVTADEVDLSDTSVRTWVNGELRQNSNTRELIFDVPTLIETMSRGITLQPGDLILTGTPAGVGLGFTPPKFLKPGDRVKLEIGGIGVLENTLEG
ncbi:fumarylacetoacetate hydrolase family protein [Azospirillum rugosum]|uniref:2-keto-4-pentenoate hydratase/2-oxohepta-3-ene-1,7-dioic acid hydratase in catechol pathway n=1 Tax=Azospirillum rugosum TaxID=416170 RepID=A0ABS4SF68_9PROT|nr:fumarylacetoacetate hydrolase family protein [Azospirillum rugosum]MBP2291219.1 2-keto-4-pentenoate hydratase/2-oxohepta-3-ene-1,7-dioic acid hydratase in catechol pathway [Azospirillum rugosum]MDQ0524717.1 2-keto-4-pentenoate hydratase/2-oxohepta-3-ene-1,7-dioic acid hydratase in catechol pathway [Azospirillum rugosum]